MKLLQTGGDQGVRETGSTPEIQERLGHSTIRVTFDTYGHLLPSLDERLRDGLEKTYRDVMRQDSQ